QGKVRILAVCGPTRLKAMPEIPTAAETVPDLVLRLTCGVFAPAVTPEPIVARLAQATASAKTDPAFDRVLEEAGLEPSADIAPATARAFLTAERERLMPKIRTARLSPSSLKPY